MNCAFAHVIASLGPPAVIDMAHRLGITQPVPDYLPITLGVKEATPLEMATVAATLAAGGVHHDPLFIERVVALTARRSSTTADHTGKRVVAQDVVDCETDLLHGVITGGTGTAAALEGATLQARRERRTTTATPGSWGSPHNSRPSVWMGAPGGRIPMTDVGGIEVFGGTYPAEVWKAFMDAELGDQPAVDLPDPGPVCARPGASITDRGAATLPSTRRGWRPRPATRRARRRTRRPRSQDRRPAPTPAPPVTTAPTACDHRSATDDPAADEPATDHDHTANDPAPAHDHVFNPRSGDTGDAQVVSN